MLNQFMLVGRIQENPTIKENEGGNKTTNINIAVQRSYKNIEGVYESDIIPITLYNNIAGNVCEYCKKGDLIGAKGRIQINENNNIQIIAEKITFLANKKEDE